MNMQQKTKAGFGTTLLVTAGLVTAFAGPAFGFANLETGEIYYPEPEIYYPEHSESSELKTCPNAVSAEEAKFAVYETPALQGIKITVALMFDNAAQKAVDADNAAKKGLLGFELIDALEKKGAVENNVVDENCEIIPAYQITSAEDNARLSIYKNKGVANDLADGTPAWIMQDTGTGLIIKAKRYKDGESLQDDKVDLDVLNRKLGYLKDTASTYAGGTLIPNAMMPK